MACNWPAWTLPVPGAVVIIVGLVHSWTGVDSVGERLLYVGAAISCGAPILYGWFVHQQEMEQLDRTVELTKELAKANKPAPSSPTNAALDRASGGESCTSKGLLEEIHRRANTLEAELLATHLDVLQRRINGLSKDGKS